MRCRAGCEGQATVEFALLLPVVALLLLALVQVGAVVRTRVMLTHGAREAARAAAVGSPDDEVAAAAARASGLSPPRLHVEVRRRGLDAVVVLTYLDPTDVALVGRLVADVELAAEASMRLESR